MRRFALLTCLLVQWAVAQTSDVADILSRSVLASKANDAKASLYAYREHQINLQIDKDGKETHRNTETWDVIGLEGSSYRKLIQRDDKPLLAKEQKREEERLAKEAATRRKETAEQRRNRLLSFSYNLSFTPEHMHLYNTVYMGEESVNGYPAYVIQGMPNAGVKPANSNEKELLHYRVKRWIDRESLVDSRVEMEVISEGSRMQPGTLVDIRNLRTADGVWLGQETRIRYNAKFFKVVGARGEQTTTRSDFRKFEVNSRLVEEP